MSRRWTKGHKRFGRIAHVADGRRRLPRRSEELRTAVGRAMLPPRQSRWQRLSRNFALPGREPLSFVSGEKAHSLSLANTQNECQRCSNGKIGVGGPTKTAPVVSNSADSLRENCPQFHVGRCQSDGAWPESEVRPTGRACCASDLPLESKASTLIIRQLIIWRRWSERFRPCRGVQGNGRRRAGRRAEDRADRNPAGCVSENRPDAFKGMSTSFEGVVRSVAI